MSGVVTATILSDGKAIDPKYIIICIDIQKEVNRIGFGSITVKDGDAPKGEFAISNTDFFEPGKQIEIKLRYEGDNDISVFKGIVIKQNLRANANSSFLTAELKDIAIKLTGVRKSSVYNDKKDSDIISEIVAGCGLQKGIISDTIKPHPQMVQYNCSDWDFILSRSDINGLIVLADDGNFSSVSPDLSGDPVHTFEYGGSNTLYHFEMEADITNQFTNISALSWDAKKQELMQAQKAAIFALKQGDLDPEKMASLMGNDECCLVTELFDGVDEIKSWANAKMIKDRLSMFRGSLSVAGDSTIVLGDLMEVKGVGDKFNGNTLITGLRHQVSEKGWQTYIQFGIKHDWFAKNDIIKRPASGLLPAVNGLQVGVVEAFEEDPEGMFRIKVNLPIIDGTDGVVWARLTLPDAGNSRGMFFIPEKGDEVIIGFLNDDPRQAVILGGLFSTVNKPPDPFTIEETNPAKGIITKENIQVLFNDDEKTFEVSTPSGNKLLLNDGEGITMEDKNGNKVTLDSSGITLKSAKDVIIDGMNITIKGTSIEVN